MKNWRTANIWWSPTKTKLVPVIFILLFGISCHGQKNNTVAVAFYNCENFFDTNDDPAKQDEDFTPDGKYHYTRKIYEQKLHNIAAVVKAMDAAVIGMAEVENKTVLGDLVRQPGIAGRGYKYEIFDGPDTRGINVALLYDPALFHVITANPIHVGIEKVSANAHTRDVLYVYGVLYGDTVHLFVNHWPSRRGGDESEPKRAIAANVVKDAINVLVKKDQGARIIVMGDFNDNPDDKSITQVLGAKGMQNEVKGNGLYDPWYELYKSGRGTEVYAHNWNLFDQVMISNSLLRNSNHKLHYSHADIFRPDFIIDHYKGHEGEPHRSFAGTHWINGYSDHFPVILYLAR